MLTAKGNCATRRKIQGDLYFHTLDSKFYTAVGPVLCLSKVPGEDCLTVSRVLLNFDE